MKMLSRLTSIFATLSKPKNPSVVLLLEEADPSTKKILHIVPETGDVERFTYMLTGARLFRHQGSRELSRDQLGIVLLDDGDLESTNQFFEDVRRHAIKSMNPKTAEGNASPGIDAVSQALRDAALASIDDRAGREPPTKAGRSYNVFLAQISRPKPGKINDFEPRSISR